MTIYNINFGIGWASSGVEYAQSYRAKLLRGLDVPLKFVFLDFMSSENIQTLTENIGFQDDEVLWLYQYFTDIPIAPTSYTLQNIKDEVYEPIVREETDGKLVRKDYYSYVRIFSEYYAPKDNVAKLYMRQFYNEDGSIVYNEYIDGQTHVYRFKHKILYSRQAFIAYFMEQLHLTSNDIVILDRASEIGQALIQHKGDSKMGVVVHAEHFSEHATDDQHVLWNNFYEYQFMQADEVDFYITATQLQNDILTQ